MSSRRRTKSKLNLVDTGVSLIIANAVTEGLAGSSLWDFVTGRQNGKYMAGRDGSARLTLPGMIRGETFSVNSSVQSLGDAVKWNFRNDGMQMVGTVLLTPILAKMGKKLLRKPVLNPMNKLIKQTGLDVKV
jgi:hypothetical protein